VYIDPELVELAQERLAANGYTRRYPPGAPYDRIARLTVDDGAATGRFLPLCAATHLNTLTQDSTAMSLDRAKNKPLGERATAPRISGPTLARVCGGLRDSRRGTQRGDLFVLLPTVTHGRLTSVR
jgi:hypothetical protein